MRVKWYTYTLHLPARVCPGVLHSDRLKVRFPSALLAGYFDVPLRACRCQVAPCNLFASSVRGARCPYVWSLPLKWFPYTFQWPGHECPLVSGDRVEVPYHEPGWLTGLSLLRSM